MSGNDPSQTASTAKTSDDKYSAFRDVDFGSGGGVSVMSSRQQQMQRIRLQVMNLPTLGDLK